MKNLIFITCFSILIYACGTNKVEEVSTTEKKVNTDSIPVAKDTITFLVEPIDEKYYCKQTSAKNYCNQSKNAENACDSLSEKRLIDKNSSIMSRHGEELIIHAKTGDVIFKNNSDENSDGYLSYMAWEVNANFITIGIYYYESFEFMVVNVETGKSFKTWGMPIFNNNHTMAIAGNSDLFAGFSNNGIQLFAQDETGWNLKMQKIIDDWGPVNLFWLNDSVILSKKCIVDQTDTISGIRTEFVKINLKREKLN